MASQLLHGKMRCGRFRDPAIAAFMRIQKRARAFAEGLVQQLSIAVLETLDRENAPGGCLFPVAASSIRTQSSASLVVMTDYEILRRDMVIPRR